MLAMPSVLVFERVLKGGAAKELTGWASRGGPPPGRGKMNLKPCAAAEGWMADRAHARARAGVPAICALDGEGPEGRLGEEMHVSRGCSRVM